MTFDLNLGQSIGLIGVLFVMSAKSSGGCPDKLRS